MSSPGFILSPLHSTTPLALSALGTQPSKRSTFISGRPLFNQPHVHRPRPSSQIEMRKGPSRFGQRSMQPKRQDQMRLPEDGTPVFAIFVRTQRAKMWYPLGAVKGDDRSKNLVNAMKGGFARGMYENALDKGIAQTVYGKDSGGRFLQNAIRMYPQLKKYTKDLEFGYRVAAKGLDDQPMKVVSRDMALPFVQWAKQKLDNAFRG